MNSADTLCARLAPLHTTRGTHEHTRRARTQTWGAQMQSEDSKRGAHVGGEILEEEPPPTPACGGRPRMTRGRGGEQ